MASVPAAEFEDGSARLQTSVLDGEREIRTALIDLMSRATTEVVALGAPPFVIDPYALPLEVETLRRGVACRAVYASGCFEIDGFAEHLRGLVTQGERARVLPDLTLKLVVVEGRRARGSAGPSRSSSRFQAGVQAARRGWV